MSVVYYKFKSAKSYDTCTFDGTGIAVFDLKKEIMVSKKLGKGTDFDLGIYNAQTNEEYTDDLALIPRNTSIIVARLPASRPGKGTAQKYISGEMPTQLLAAQKRVVVSGPGANVPTSSGMSYQNQSMNGSGGAASATGAPAAPSLEGLSESEMIKAMFQQSENYWEQTQEKMASARYITQRRGGPPQPRPPPSFSSSSSSTRPPNTSSHTNNNTNNPTTQYHFRPSFDPDRPPPPGYVCYRCGERSHYIQFCPHANDPAYDNKPRLKRTTGIPKTFLKVIETPASSATASTTDAGATASNGNSKGNVGTMVTHTGEIVVAVTSDDVFAKLTQRTKGVFSSDALYESLPVKEGFGCGICHKLVRAAVKTPCCSSVFCDECVTNSLLENKDLSLRMKCPSCNKPLSPDACIPDVELRTAVEKYVWNASKNPNNPDLTRKPAPTTVKEEPAPPSTSSTPPSTTISASSSSSNLNINSVSETVTIPLLSNTNTNTSNALPSYIKKRDPVVPSAPVPVPVVAASAPVQPYQQQQYYPPQTQYPPQQNQYYPQQQQYYHPQQTYHQQRYHPYRPPQNQYRPRPQYPPHQQNPQQGQQQNQGQSQPLPPHIRKRRY